MSAPSSDTPPPETPSLSSPAFSPNSAPPSSISPADYPTFFSPELPILKGQNRLPHWDQQGRTYTITFRLADSIPTALKLKIQSEQKVWCADHPEPRSPALQLEFHKRFTTQLELCMDEGHGTCIFRQTECARLLADTIRFHEGIRTKLYAWVIMPNHVHILTGLLEPHQLPTLMESWKGYSARNLNQHLHRQGSLWQKSYHDRIIRNWDHFGNVVRYIRRNPGKANLRSDEYLAWESPLARLF